MKSSSMMRPFILVAILLSRTLYGQLPSVDFDPSLPANWTAAHQAQTNGVAGYMERVTKVNRAGNIAQIYIQVATPSALEKPPAPFKPAAEAWKKSAPANAKRAGMEISEEQFKILPHRTGEQAVFSFKASKGGKAIFMSAVFWIEAGCPVKVGIYSGQDIREDKDVLNVVNSIRLKQAP